MEVRTASRMRRLAVAAVVLGVVVLMVFALQRRLLYFPAGEPRAVEQVLPSARAVELTTDDGLELGAWYLEAGSTAVAVFPGNAGNRENRVPLAEALSDLGFSVLLVDYRGYGGNPGTPSEDGLVTDARAAVRWLDAQPHVERTVYLGESLGAGVAVALAAEHPPSALVLRSPFTSLVAVARHHYGPVPSWLLRDRFEVAEGLADLDVPTLVIAGDRDGIVPLSMSREVETAAAGPSRLVVVEGAGHNDRVLLDGPEVVAAIEAFVGAHTPD